MALNTAIRGLQIRDAFFGDGLKRNAGDGDIAELDLKTGGGLKIDTYQLAVEPSDFVGAGLVDNLDNIDVNVDDVTLEIASGNIVQVKDGGISDVKLVEDYLKVSEYSNTFLLETDTPDTYEGQALKGVRVNSGATALEFYTITDTAGMLESAVKYENESANCNGSNVEFTLASTPVANSVQVYLNGLLQEAGSGKDYTISGTTITFTTAPETGDILLVHYVATA